jgi:hypothetical protein
LFSPFLNAFSIFISLGMSGALFLTIPFLNIYYTKVWRV